MVPLPGGAEVKYTSSGLSVYRMPDWLGSLRADSNPNRTYNGSLAFAPFGERYSVSGTPAYAFTGARPDIVNDEYDFLLRKYHSTQGRWISPDPAGLAAAQPTNPQSWNRYAYVMNNPLAVIDPDGLGGPGSNCINGGGADSCPPADRNFHLMGDLASGCNATIDFGPLCFNPVGWNIFDWKSMTVKILSTKNVERAFDWKPVGNGLELVGLGAANNESYAWTFTKAFFKNFSVFGPKNDPRPSCFGNFLKDSAANFVGIPGIDTVAGGAAAYYGVSLSQAQAIPNTRVARGGISPSQWLEADEAARIANAGKFSLALNAVVAEGQAIANEVPSALAGECK